MGAKTDGRLCDVFIGHEAPLKRSYRPRFPARGKACDFEFLSVKLLRTQVAGESIPGVGRHLDAEVSAHRLVESGVSRGIACLAAPSAEAS